MRRQYLFLLAPWLVAGASACAQAQAQAQDPPARAGRVSFIDGSVSLYPAGDTAWTDASLNYPLTTGDAIWADTSARAEIELGPSVVRLDAQTALVFGEISDSVTQMRIDQGALEVRILQLGDNDVYEIDTPSGVISLDATGDYRVDVTPDGKRATLTVRSGAADITGDNRTVRVAEGQSAVLADSDQPPELTGAVPVDDWERWADERAANDADLQATNYVSPDVVGYEDLDDNGTWQVDATYGNVWIPRNVPSDWAPYRFGHWQSVAPWGWTWIDDEPWGFAPFHYGRWAYVTGRWGWVPGARDVQPVYAPALVAFVSSPQWNAGVSAGGPGVGWVPLAPGEPFVPAYHASSGYVLRVNLNNVNNANFDPTHVDVDQIHYANRGAPNGITVVPRDVFDRARAVDHATLTVRAADVTAAHANPAPTAGGQRIAAPPRPIPVGRPGNQPISHPPALGTAHAPPPRPAQWHSRPQGTQPTPAHAPPPEPTAQRPEPSHANPPAVHEARPSMRPVPPSQPAEPSPTPRQSGPPSPRPTPEVPTPPATVPGRKPAPAPAPTRRTEPRPRPEAPPSPRPTPQPPATPTEPARTTPAPPPARAPDRTPRTEPQPSRQPPQPGQPAPSPAHPRPNPHQPAKAPAHDTSHRPPRSNDSTGHSPP